MKECQDCGKELSDYCFMNGSDVCDYCNAMKGDE